MNIALGPQWEAFIAESLRSGHYQSASDVILEGLRLLRERTELQPQTMADLEREVGVGIDALDQGDYREMDLTGMREHLDDIKLRGRERLSQAK